MFELLLKLVLCHYLADFGLQSTDMIELKNPHVSRAPTVAPWPYWLTAHASIQALFVWMVTGNWLIGMMEFFMHGAIDLGKCNGNYNIHIDQAAHLTCKVVWAWLVVASA